MGKPSWRRQVFLALEAINQIGESKYEAKRAQDWKPGQSVAGLYSYGYLNTVFDRAMTFTGWVEAHYPDVHEFRDVDSEMVAEFLSEKNETCSPDTVRTLIATLRKLQEGLSSIGWVRAPIVPGQWSITGKAPPRGPYTLEEADAIVHLVKQGSREYGQALQFILSSGARIDETLHLRSDKIFIEDKKVELIGKGGRTRRIRVLRPNILNEIERSGRFVFLRQSASGKWKPGLEAAVRRGCDDLGIQRRGVHGLRATAACEFVRIKELLGCSEAEARRELAPWLGHNPHRTEVTYAYVPRERRGW